MWANPWIIKEICGSLIKIFCICGGAYFIAETFAKITYKTHKKRMLKNK